VKLELKSHYVAVKSQTFKALYTKTTSLRTVMVADFGSRSLEGAAQINKI